MGPVGLCSIKGVVKYFFDHAPRFFRIIHEKRKIDIELIHNDLELEAMIEAFVKPFDLEKDLLIHALVSQLLWKEQ